MAKYLRKAPLGAAAFVRRLQFELGRKLLVRVKAACESSTLRSYLQLYEVFDGAAVIGVPHYWAAYYNDDRKGFNASTTGKRFLVWFRNPSDDPRIAGGYPIRYTDWRSLTKEEFALGIEINRALGGPPLTGPFMVAVPSVGPREGSHFFERGFRGFLREAGARIVEERFRAYVRPLIRSEKDEVVIPAIRFGG